MDVAWLNILEDGISVGYVVWLDEAKKRVHVREIGLDAKLGYVTQVNPWEALMLLPEDGMDL